jgi:DNA-binding NtrC family response regulator
MRKMLVIDKDESLCEDVCNYLHSTGNMARRASDYAGALEQVQKEDFDVIISDVSIPGGTIRALVAAVREKSPNTIVIVNSEIDTVQEGVRAVKEGAFGIIQKPFSLPELTFHIKKALEKRQEVRKEEAGPPDRFRNVYQPYNFIGECSEIKAAFKIVNLVAKTNSSVLITGETGTGKELVAGAIHYNSDRSKGPFVRVNCAALPEQLLESELFGYEKGAFTGAEKLRIGRFEQASGGTIFLDEVADMSLYTQAKVLRVLQEREFERLGSSQTVKTDVRIISATNKDLVRQIEQGRFREDLYYRLNVVAIHIPPLRERGDDLRLLIQFFLKKFAVGLNKRIRGIDPAALQALLDYHWPGNIRELENTMERAVLLCEGEEVTSAGVGRLHTPSKGAVESKLISLPPGGVDLEEVERSFVQQALERTRWVQKDAAKLLGVSSRVLNYKIKRFGMTHPSWKLNR